MGAEHPVTKEELNQGIDVAVGDKAGLEGEGVSEPNPDPENHRKSAGQDSQMEGEQPIQNLRGEQREKAKNPQVSWHILHKS